ncbi:MAG: hypothetical protein ACJARX_001393, partial [Psychroserpens sp.]
ATKGTKNTADFLRLKKSEATNPATITDHQGKYRDRITVIMIVTTKFIIFCLLILFFIY